METSYEIMNILSIDAAKKFAEGKTVVIITGVTGQDGSFMADYLLNNTDYEGTGLKLNPGHIVHVTGLI